MTLSLKLPGQPVARSVEAVVIGASAGAVEALSAILPALDPARFDIPLIIAVHLPPDRDSLLADLYRDRTRMEVREATDKDTLRGGVVYLAPAGYHLLVEKRRTLALSLEAPVNFSRPAIDVLFDTAADAYGAGLLGIVLTGANSDGAEGISKIGQRGGLTIVQAPDSAHMPEMPRAAISRINPDAVMTLSELTGVLGGNSSGPAPKPERGARRAV